ncbi:trichoplein keratin filament-binding protein [Bombina bombina]|uniref:trichoplein keratin filament-binding protein n=1 Tax=Bombina bombina TaxID=8345 RepID=UPI00235A941E|nr:trichoplein keratin filament-binding protein [Bombina bombina]
MVAHDKDPKSVVSINDCKIIRVPTVLPAMRSQKYTDFLLEQERMIGPEGYLDSKRYANSYMVRKGLAKTKSVIPVCREKRSNEATSEEQRLQDSLCQKRQEVRSLRRSQGDVMKECSALQDQFKAYEYDIQKKLSDGEKQIKDIQRQNEDFPQKESKRREQVTKDSILQNRLELLSTKSGQKDRETILMGVRQAESLRREDRRRQDLESERHWAEKKLRAIEQQRWQLEAERSATLTRLSRKKAEESRKDLEIKNQMKKNLESQQRLQQDIAQLRSQHMAEKARNQQTTQTSEKKTANVPCSEQLSLDEIRRLGLEHGVAHIQRSVSLGKKFEKQLYAGVRSAEYSYKKSSEVVTSLQQELIKKRQENSAQLQKVISEAAKKEQDLLLHLAKEEGQLRRLQNQRQSKYWRLLDHRSHLKEELHALEKLEKERQWLSHLNPIISSKERTKTLGEGNLL